MQMQLAPAKILNSFPELQNERKQKWIDDYQYCWNDMYSGNSLELEQMGMTIEYASEHPRAIFLVK